MLTVIARLTKPAVWLLSKTSAAILSLFGLAGTLGSAAIKAPQNISFI